MKIQHPNLKRKGKKRSKTKWKNHGRGNFISEEKEKPTYDYAIRYEYVSHGIGWKCRYQTQRCENGTEESNFTIRI